MATNMSKCGPDGRTVLVPVQSGLREYFGGVGDVTFALTPLTVNAASPGSVSERYPGK
jgi:hypothetical protein